MSAGILIRRAEISDVPAISQVNYITWIDTYRGMIPDAELDALNLESLVDKWMQILDVSLARSGTFVAVKGESIVAYSRFYPTTDSDDNPFKVATIGSMYVHPNFQRQGIGSLLMSAILDAISENEFTESTLHVLNSNEQAREFYESLGWIMDSDAVTEDSDNLAFQKTRYRLILV